MSDTLKWVAGIFAAVGTIAGGMNWYVDYRIDTYLKNKKGGFRTELSEEVGLPEHKISTAFGELYRSLHDVSGSIDTFKNKYLPMLERERNMIDVGLKVDKSTGEVTYEGVDGRKYIPVIGSTGKYYIVYSNGVSEWCY